MSQEFQRKMDAKLIAAIVATGLLSFTGVVIETAMNVTFPTLMRELDVNLATVQWVTTGYLLALAIVAPASAFFKKRFHARTLFAAANLLFIGGTVLGYLAPSFAVLLTGRILQGIGTGVALPLMFNIVMEQAPKDRIGMVMGCATLVVAMAPAVGPSVGGLIVNGYGWRMIFLALLPILAFSLIIGLPSIRQVTALTRAALPLRSYLLLAASFTAFILAASLAGDLGWTDPLVLILFAASALFLYAFCRSSMHDTEPLIHLSVFRRGAFRLSVLGLVLLQFICLGIGFFIPNFAQIVLGENPFVAGCILLPGCLIGAVLAPFSGRLLDRFGARRPILTGCVFIILATLGFAVLLAEADAPLLTGIYIAFTLGQAFVSGNTMVSGLGTLPQELRADGNAVFNTMQQLAGAVGTAIVATVISMPQAYMADLAAATRTGSGHACILLLALAFVQFICMERATKIS